MKSKMSFIHSFYWAVLRISRHNRASRWLIDVLAFWFYKLFRSGKTFTYRGRVFPYFYHLYNRTVAGERVVEIPIARNFLNRYRGKAILEVGNVMSHYYPAHHTVLDKYEKGEEVINADVADYSFGRKFDLIISVSTMEHVGYSYGEKYDSTKFMKGVKNLIKHLNKGGVLVVTCPVFYNPVITKLIFSKRMPFTESFFMERVSYLNEWKQIGFKDLPLKHSYDGHYANANFLYIGTYINKKKTS